MDLTQLIEPLYLVTGLLLPLFYFPQIKKLYVDDTGLSSYSTSKAGAQLLLRVPALIFAVFVVNSNYMIVVLTFDLLGRLVEFVVAIHALRRQGLPVAPRIFGGLLAGVRALLEKAQALRVKTEQHDLSGKP